MNALEGWLISRWRYAALLALAALLAAGAVIAFGAQQRVEAQTENANTMQTGDDTDRSNFRLELSLVDDSDNIVPAGSKLRVKAVVKFDVPNTKTNGVSAGADHGAMGRSFRMQAGSTLRIAGQFEWENAGGRTLRIDLDRMGVNDFDPDAADQNANCKVPVSTGTFVDDFTDTAGRVLYSTAAAVQATPTLQRNFGAADCVTAPSVDNGRVLPPHPEDWKRTGYSSQGYIANGYDLLPDRDGVQGSCTPSTVEDTTTWSCELSLVDEQFGWRTHPSYSALNGVLTAGTTPNWESWSLLARRFAPNDDDASITIPSGTPDGTFTISGSVILHSALGRMPAQSANNTDKITLTDSLVVTVGAVSEASTAEFGFAPQVAGDPDLPTVPPPSIGSPWLSQADANGGKTKLQLRILNEGGKPSARNSVSSIVMRTNLGTLKSNIDDGEATDDGCVGTGALTCQVLVSSLNTTNSGNIVFTLSAPANKKAGTAQVTGSVVNSRGEVLPIETLTVTFVGTASTISVSEPSSSILNVGTTDDNRDQLTLSVSAADSAGQRARVPTTSQNFTLRDPDNNRVSASDSTINVEWPLQTTGDSPTDARDARGNLQARITVGAAAASALKTGEYTLEIRAGGLRDSQTFIVAGEAANVEVVSSESDYAPNEQFTLTATVTNADGSTVPDGTPVVFSVGSEIAGQAKIVQLRARTNTKGGEASATYVVIAQGRAWVTVTSGNGNGIWIRTVGQAAAPPEAADPAAQLSGRAGLASYLGTADVQASELLRALGNVTAIRLYRAGVWVLYGVVDARPLPGSEDFTITRGNVLWIGS